MPAFDDQIRDLMRRQEIIRRDIQILPPGNSEVLRYLVKAQESAHMAWMMLDNAKEAMDAPHR